MTRHVRPDGQLQKQREITGETISMSISVYLLLGLTWGLLYIVIFTRHPEAFSFGTSPGVRAEHVFPIFVYFSPTTQSTIGFGDIIGASNARSQNSPKLGLHGRVVELC